MVADTSIMVSGSLDLPSFSFTTTLHNGTTKSCHTMARMHILLLWPSNDLLIRLLRGCDCDINHQEPITKYKHLQACKHLDVNDSKTAKFI
jgi:hypothetical protein